ncbi:MAG: ribonuclease H-like domain-containing protein [Acidobacteriia bacterium]|nr:ribonuclease H-like domain-containing protein [Terriglobia bacterium]
MKNLTFDFSGTGAGPLVLDVETQYLSDEVPGGWNSVDKFRIALVVTWDQQSGSRVWYEEDARQLLQEAEKFDPIVTFNGEGFDFRVLSAYGPVDVLYRKSKDMLALLSKKLGFRVKLDSLAQATLGHGKTGSGTECVTWWRSGDPVLRQKAIDYCRMDVELTRDIYLFGKERGYLLIDDARQNTRRRVEVSW